MKFLRSTQGHSHLDQKRNRYNRQELKIDPPYTRFNDNKENGIRPDV